MNFKKMVVDTDRDAGEKSLWDYTSVHYLVDNNQVIPHLVYTQFNAPSIQNFSGDFIHAAQKGWLTSYCILINSENRCLESLK